MKFRARQMKIHILLGLLWGGPGLDEKVCLGGADGFSSERLEPRCTITSLRVQSLREPDEVGSQLDSDEDGQKSALSTDENHSAVVEGCDVCRWGV